MHKTIRIPSLEWTLDAATYAAKPVLAKVDAAHWPPLHEHTWACPRPDASVDSHPVRFVDGGMRFMDEDVMRLETGYEIDHHVIAHENSDPLDCRAENLSIDTDRANEKHVTIEASDDETLKVSSTDQDLVQYNWHRATGDYYFRWKDNEHVYLHQLIALRMRDGEPIPDGYEVDHVDGNTRNNTRSNLRVVPEYMNKQNVVESEEGTSPYRGVSYDDKEGRWVAWGHDGDQTIRIGSFDDEDEAAAASSQWRMDHYEGYVARS